MAAGGVWTLCQGDCDQLNHRNSHAYMHIAFAL